MSIQNSLSKASTKVRRRLFDENVKRKGRTVQGLKISIKEDMFQNQETEAVLADEEITVVINFPDDIPLDRVRLDGSSAVSQTRTFFFDILPMEVFSEFSDKLETNDYIFFYFLDEENNMIPMIIKISETFGRFTTDMIWKKHYAAFSNGDVPPEIINLIKTRYDL